MPEKEQYIFQFKLEDFQKNNNNESSESVEVFLFKNGTIIYPKNQRSGVMQGDMFANKIEEKIKGYSGFISRESVKLYLDGEYRTLAEGSKFGAPSKSAKKRKINLNNGL